jgi:hypothetical protein
MAPSWASGLIRRGGPPANYFEGLYHLLHFSVAFLIGLHLFQWELYEELEYLPGMDEFFAGDVNEHSSGELVVDGLCELGVELDLLVL